MKGLKRRIVAMLMATIMVFSMVGMNDSLMVAANGNEEVSETNSDETSSKEMNSSTVSEITIDNADTENNEGNGECIPSSSGNAGANVDTKTEGNSVFCDTEEGIRITVSGAPLGTIVSAKSVREIFDETEVDKLTEMVTDAANADSSEEVVAYDINLYDENGDVWEPQETDNVRVTFENLQFENNEGSILETYWVSDDIEEVEQVTVVETGENLENVTFEVEHFSIYATIVVGDKDRDQKVVQNINFSNADHEDGKVYLGLNAVDLDLGIGNDEYQYGLCKKEWDAETKLPEGVEIVDAKDIGEKYDHYKGKDEGAAAIVFDLERFPKDVEKFSFFIADKKGEIIQFVEITINIEKAGWTAKQEFGGTSIENDILKCAVSGDPVDIKFGDLVEEEPEGNEGDDYGVTYYDVSEAIIEPPLYEGTYGVKVWHRPTLTKSGYEMKYTLNISKLQGEVSINDVNKEYKRTEEKPFTLMATVKGYGNDEINNRIAEKTKIEVYSEGNLVKEGTKEISINPSELSAGTYTYVAKYVGDDYCESCESDEKSFKIVKATPEFKVKSETITRTYNTEMVNITGEFEITSEGRITYKYYACDNLTTPLNEAPKNAGSYKVVVETAETENYESGKSEPVSLVINKAKVKSATAENTTGAVLNQKLEYANIVNAQAETENGLKVSGRAEWKNPEEVRDVAWWQGISNGILGAKGYIEKGEEAYFIPEDTDNYEIDSNFSFTIPVRWYRYGTTITAEADDKSYDEKEYSKDLIKIKSISIAGAEPMEDEKQIKELVPNPGIQFNTPDGKAPKDIGTYTAEVSMPYTTVEKSFWEKIKDFVWGVFGWTEDTIIAGSKTNVNFEIGKGKTTFTIDNVANVNYGDPYSETEEYNIVSYTIDHEPEREITWKYYKSDKKTEIVGRPTEPGTYYIQGSVGEGEKYGAAVSKKRDFEIKDGEGNLSFYVVKSEFEGKEAEGTKSDSSEKYTAAGTGTYKKSVWDKIDRPKDNGGKATTDPEVLDKLIKQKPSGEDLRQAMIRAGYSAEEIEAYGLTIKWYRLSESTHIDGKVVCGENEYTHRDFKLVVSAVESTIKVYRVTDEDGKEKKTEIGTGYEIGASGKVEITIPTAGDYVVEQIDVKGEYELAKSKKVSFDYKNEDDLKGKEVTLENSIAKYEFNISTTHNSEFDSCSENAQYGIVKVGTENDVKRYKALCKNVGTGENEWIEVIPDELGIVSTPEGYELVTKNKQFSVVAGTYYVFPASCPEETYFTNYAKSDEKHFSRTESTSEDGDEYTAQFNLADKRYDLEISVKDENGKVITEKAGFILKRIESGEEKKEKVTYFAGYDEGLPVFTEDKEEARSFESISGKIVFENLERGVYIFDEVQEPSGYIAPKPQEVMVDDLHDDESIVRPAFKVYAVAVNKLKSNGNGGGGTIITVPDGDTPTTDKPDNGSGDNGTTEIPDEDTPTTDKPDDGNNSGDDVEDNDSNNDGNGEDLTDIEDGDVPLDDGSNATDKNKGNNSTSNKENNNDLANIEDDATPLSDNPLTGDSAPIAWACLAIFAAAGLAGVTFAGKRKKENE